MLRSSYIRKNMGQILLVPSEKAIANSLGITFVQFKNNSNLLSHDRLLLSQYPNYVNANQWCSLGDDFFCGENRQIQNYKLAYSCFKMASIIDQQKAYAWYSMGWQLQHGEGIAPDLQTAKRSYEIASDLGYSSATKRLLRMDNPHIQNADQWCL